MQDSMLPPKLTRKPTLTLDASIVQDNIPIEIVPKIYIGSIHAACNEDALLERGISHILNSSRFPPMYPAKFSYLSMDLRDKEDSNILFCIPASNIFIESGLEACGSVLVHCFGGRSRSAALIGAYLMMTRRISFDDVLKLLRSSRPVVSINRGFEVQLRSYYEANFDVYEAQQILLRKNFKIGRISKKLSKMDPSMTTAMPREDRNHANSSGHKRVRDDSSKMETDSDEDNAPSCESDLKYKTKFDNDHKDESISNGEEAGNNKRSKTKAEEASVPKCIWTIPGSNKFILLPAVMGLASSFCCSKCQTELFRLANVLKPGFQMPMATFGSVDSCDGIDADDGMIGDDGVLLGPADIDIDAAETAELQGLSAPIVALSLPPKTTRKPKEMDFVFEDSMETSPSTQPATVVPMPTITPRHRGSKSFLFDDHADVAIGSISAESPSTSIVNSVISPVLQSGSVSSNSPHEMRSTSRNVSFANSSPRSSSIMTVSSSNQLQGISFSQGNAVIPVDSLIYLTNDLLTNGGCVLAGSICSRILQMTMNDDAAVKRVLGTDEIVFIEYIDWMGEDILRHESDCGTIKCKNCRFYVGGWSWRPNERFEGLPIPVIHVDKSCVRLMEKSQWGTLADH